MVECQSCKKAAFFLTFTLSLDSTHSALLWSKQKLSCKDIIWGEIEGVFFEKSFAGYPVWSAYSQVSPVQRSTKKRCKDSQNWIKHPSSCLLAASGAECFLHSSRELFPWAEVPVKVQSGGTCWSPLWKAIGMRKMLSAWAKTTKLNIFLFCALCLCSVKSGPWLSPQQQERCLFTNTEPPEHPWWGACYGLESPKTSTGVHDRRLL